jgi:hypothetical protein
MRKRRRWLLIVAGPLIVLAALAYQLIAPRSHMLFPPRAANGVDYVLYTHVPDACRSGGCPAVYVLDGERWVPLFARIDDERSASHDMAPVIVVGIGYRDVVGTVARRKHDFTPAFGRTPGQTGGADAYIDVLRREIIPYAEAHLPISTERRAIAGHSYGGLFATYAMAKAPELFDAYLIMSPALWFDDGKIYRTPFAPAPAPLTVFLAADTPRGGTSNMARDVGRLNQLLLARSDVSTSRSLLIGTTHDTMVEPAVAAGLPALFPPN